MAAWGHRMALGQPEFRIDIDLGHAEREAQRIRDLLAALRQRHDLSRYEYTRLVQIVPAGPTHSHPILTLGTRFAESEDHLLATYLHEQMHWYLWRLGGVDHDPVAPFFDELVRRYPKAPTRLPEGARNYEQTYIHLVVCWLDRGRHRPDRRGTSARLVRYALGLPLDLSHRAARSRGAGRALPGAGHLADAHARRTGRRGPRAQRGARHRRAAKNDESSAAASLAAIPP